MSATPPEANTEYSRGAGRSLRVSGRPEPRPGRSQPAPARPQPAPARSQPAPARSQPQPREVSGPARGAVLACATLGALLLIVAEFTALFTVRTASGPVKTVGTGAHDSYALVPIAVAAAALAVVATARGSRPALLAVGCLGVVALLIALVGDLPDAHATGVVGNSLTGFRQASDRANTGLYMETLGAILLIIASGSALLLGAGRGAAR